MLKKNKKNQEKSQKIVSGRAMPQKREAPKTEDVSLDTERDRARKKTKKRTRWSVVGIILIVGTIGGFSAMVVGNLIEMMKTTENVVLEEKFEPTVKILDENGTGEISERTKEFVGQLEADLKDFDLKVVRATLPIGKMREVDINLEGFAPYFKVNIDRGTGVSAEDIARMVKYLKERNLVEGTSYVDVRVEGKAFYK